jgi:arylsulfatase A-like enzyme
VWWWLASCGWWQGPSVVDEPPAEVPVQPPPRAPAAIPLGRPSVPGTFALPPSSRPGQQAAPKRFPLMAPLEFVGTRKLADLYRTPLPVLDNLLPSETGGTHFFGSKEPPGFVVSGPNGRLDFAREARTANSYGFDRQWLYIGLKKGTPPPDPAAFTIGFAKATDTENGLNLATSGLGPEAFARRTVTMGVESWSGLYLPPPAEATFSLTLPERAQLSFEARLLAPAIASATPSDGADIEVLVGGSVVHKVHVPFGQAVPVTVDLSEHAGPTTLTLRTSPGPAGDSTLDYLMLEAPTVYVRDAQPMRVILVFIDTLRADHLGFMGYERPTSPMLDRLAAHAAVFTQARAVAPWTLPSARSMLTGSQPEAWYESQTLAEALGDAGWRTEALVSNAFLSQPFDMHRGWDHFLYEHQLPADQLVERAVSIIEENPHRDLLLMVHFMEPHLPYDEPYIYRRRFTGSRPDPLKWLTRGEIQGVRVDQPEFEDVKYYVTGRYDQNIRYVDAQLHGLFDAAGEQATVVLLSDHGEELWEHGGFEHGHTFYDELLHVPLVIRSPYVTPGRYDAPVSLLDVTPTVREIAGLPPISSPIPGRSLVPLTFGDTGAAEALAARSLAFGRPLYGTDGWGIVSSGHKWWDRGGEQALFELLTDPGELDDLAPGKSAEELARWPAALETALERKVEHVWRLDLTAVEWEHDLELTISHPGGFSRAWLGYDPRGRGSEPVVTDGRVSLHIEEKTAAPPTLYMVPTGDPYEPKGLAVTLVGRGVMVGGTCTRSRLSESHDPQTILATGNERFHLLVDLAWVPEPSGTSVSGFHPDLEAQLRQLGYLGEDH